MVRQCYWDANGGDSGVVQVEMGLDLVIGIESIGDEDQHQRHHLGKEDIWRTGISWTGEWTAAE